jgi:hypothetical protein
MPSILHEALTQMFRRRPSLAAELLSGPLGLGLPAHQQARLDAGELNDLAPTEYRADVVVALTGADALVLAVVVEVQLGRDTDKRWSWPVYLATLRARLRCPTVLLVVCADTVTAGWCATPIELGHPGWSLRPLVLGPELVPVVADAEEARCAPELAVLSALAHGADQERDKVLRALPAALAAVDTEHAVLYAEVVFAALPAAARRYLEALMTTGYREYQSDFVRRFVNQGRAEGEAKGEAKALLAVLAARGIEVPDEARARITGCSDVEQLEVWIRRAVTVSSVHHLFDE